MLTSTHRQLSDDLLFLPERRSPVASMSTGASNRNISLVGYRAGSHVSGDASAINRLEENSRHYYQRPDATSVRLDSAATTLSGSSAKMAIRKIGGERVRFSSAPASSRRGSISAMSASSGGPTKRPPTTGCRSAARSRRAGSVPGISTSTNTPVGTTTASGSAAAGT